MSEIHVPRERANQIGRADIEASLRQTMASGALNHGWIITGGIGAGKATLAYRIARGVLNPSALGDANSFSMAADVKTFKLVAQDAHPDLFVAERLWNEKTSKYQSEITVETIRNLSAFLSRTAALGGARVAIIDAADDLNRNAANALLKVLEEPPRDTLLILLSASPGRLLATIRSRCRRIDLRDVSSFEIAGLIESEGLSSGATAKRIAEHARGRPGYAISLAADGGAKALGLADEFLKAGRTGKAAKVAAAFTARTPSEEWEFFTSAVTSQLSDAARAGAREGSIEGPLSGASASDLLEGWARLTRLIARGDALNLDRSQLVSAMAYDLGKILRARS